MKLNICLTVSTFTALFLTSEAHNYEVKVHQNATYKASPGEELRINCTIHFCKSSPQTVSWYKLNKIYVPLNMSNQRHIRTERISLNHLQGMSVLVFHNVVRSDSGFYRCQTGFMMSLDFSVSINGPAQIACWPFAYRAGVMVVFVGIVTTCFLSAYRHKGESKVEEENTTQSSYDVKTNEHIYENDW